MRTLVVWCPDWPVTALGFSPSDEVAVLEAGRVVASSKAARAAGVRSGLRRREAESRCVGLVVCSRDVIREAAGFEPVVAAVSELTPKVEATRPGLLALDVRGPVRAAGGEVPLCRRVAAIVASVLPGANGPVPSVGIADGRFAAALAARRGVVVPVGQNAGFLAPLPIAALRAPDLAQLLVRLGIRTLGGFARLPEEAVLSRFGTEGGSAQRLAQGLEEGLLSVAPQEEELVRVAELDPPAERAETAAFVARSLAAGLVAMLERRGLSCTRVRIEAETEHGESLSRLWGGSEALGADAMVERLRWQLDGWLSGSVAEAAPTAGITGLRLVADEVVAASGRQLCLWGGPTDADRRAVRGLDRLRGMLGPEAVLTATLSGGRGPSERVRFMAWGAVRPVVRPSSGPWPGHHPLPAPGLVHRVPLPAEVRGADGAAVSVSGRGRLSAVPERLSIGGEPFVAIRNWAGPWTTDERWWDPRARRRRARFQILTDDEHAHLCALEEGHWSIEASYD